MIGAGNVELAEDLGRIPTSAGRVAIVRVSGDLQRPRWERPYVAVVVERSELYLGPEVAMLITVYDERDADEDVARFGVGAWSGQTRQINNVFAVPEFRLAPAEFPETPAVLVGQFLARCQAFSVHSAHRTELGHKWALRVGGLVPSADVVSDDSVPELHAVGADMLAAIQREGWWSEL